MIEKILATTLLVPMGDPSDAQTKWGLNTMLWGDPGIGKSDRVEAAGAMIGLPVRTTYVPTCQPEDASGAPFVNTSKTTAYLDALVEQLGESPEEFPGFLRNAAASLKKTATRYGGSFSRIEATLPGVSDLMVDGQGIWFIDELSSGRPAVQAAFLGATLTRRVGGMQLPPGIRIVAAGNPAESAAGGWELEPPMANRFAHFDVRTPTNDEWSEWLTSGGAQELLPIEDGEATVRANWADQWPVVCGLMGGFLSAAGKGTSLHDLPKEGDKARGRAWPSPRTWAFAARAMATCRCLGTDDATMMAIIQGCVGEGASVPFYAWVKNADLPTPSEVLTKGWKVDKKRLDRNFAVYSAMTAYVINRQDVVEKRQLAVHAWNRLGEAADANLLDLTDRYARVLVRAGLSTTTSPELKKAATPVLTRIVKSPLGGK
jgi:hypothetical protein